MANWGAYLTLLKWTYLATRFSQHPSVLTGYRVWLVYPTPYPKLL